jgi:hypothetical protein
MERKFGSCPPEAWAEHYWGRVPTRRLAHPQRHSLRYAA